MWQKKAAEAMAEFVRGLFPVDKIEIKGSMLDPDLLDVYSDVDMEVFLQDEADFHAAEFICKLSDEFGVFGYQIHRHENSDLLRICLDNGWRFDLSFVYTKGEAAQPAGTFEDIISSVANEFWFMAVMVLVKRWRGDYLIASHLALELCQLIIVVQMIERDNAKNTNFHRFGDKENVPVFDALLGLQTDTVCPILNILFLAAEHMDTMLLRLNPSYPRRAEKLKASLV